MSQTSANPAPPLPSGPPWPPRLEAPDVAAWNAADEAGRRRMVPWLGHVEIMHLEGPAAWSLNICEQIRKWHDDREAYRVVVRQHPEGRAFRDDLAWLVKEIADAAALAEKNRRNRRR